MSGTLVHAKTIQDRVYLDANDLLLWISKADGKDCPKDVLIEEIESFIAKTKK